jgi:hypothetical protein
MHDIVFLWSHPRSLSTALERVMVQRGDLRTLHEPFIYLYYVGDAKKKLAHFDPHPSHPTSYAEIRRMILRAAETEPLFVKDMCYYVIDYILADSEFLERITNTFLIRNPARAIASYYKLDKSFTREEVGIEAQYRVFDKVRALTGQTPVVLDAEDLQQDPDATISAYCRALGMEHRASALQWDGPLPKDWQFVVGWHSSVAGSTGIQKPTRTAPVDLDVDPRLRRSYEYHLPFYEKMHAHKMCP